MKKYQIIGFTLSTMANSLLILRLKFYFLIVPLFIAQIIISVCFSVLFCIDFSSRAMRITVNLVSAVLTLLDIYCIIYIRQPIGLITLISTVMLIIKNILC